jgi:hypothetical protein
VEIPDGLGDELDRALDEEGGGEDEEHEDKED